MSAFKVLRDVSNSFEEDLRRISGELFTANIGETFEDGIAKKLQDLSLHTSKLRLLQAKSASPQIADQQKDELSTIAGYSETVKGKLVQHQVVKAITQSHAVKALVTASDSSLDPEMMERKEKIIEQLTKFKDKERQLLHLDAVLREREQELERVRQEWDRLLGLLREMRSDDSDSLSDDHSNPLSKCGWQYINKRSSNLVLRDSNTSVTEVQKDNKLQSLQGKERLMRTLLSRLAVARSSGYDWLSDPHRRLRALQLARQ